MTPAVRVAATVDEAAIAANVARLRGVVGEGSALCVVVKADGYGHGARRVATVARAAGAEWIAVVSAQEASALREAGLDGPLLVMGALTPAELEIAVGVGADVVAWTTELARAAIDLPGTARLHVKLDTGMGRLGTRDPSEADAIADLVAAADPTAAVLVGAMTHFATADDRADAFLDVQLERFLAWAGPLRERHPDVLLHAANSAATLRDARTHLDMVRCGVATYGLDPFGVDPAREGLVPALALRSVVAAVKPCPAGESAGYGRRYVATRDTVLATVPIGYGDGWRRGLTNRAEVLVGGRRFPQVGTVSMDNVTVDLGPDGGGVEVGDVVTLLGADGDERILAEEVAAALDTINYEVTCGLLPRVPRRSVGDPGA